MDLFGGAFLLDCQEFRDHRGTFLESYREQDFALPFVQGNISVSRRNVVRGLHYQVSDPQGKFMRTAAGATRNLIVDMRFGSPTLGKAFSTMLDRPSLALWVPPGFANGFASFSDAAVVIYEATSYYRSEDDRSLFAFDPAFADEWPPGLKSDAIMSEKDRSAPWLQDAELVPQHQWRSAS